MADAPEIKPAAYAKMAALIKEDAKRLMTESRCETLTDGILVALLSRMDFSEDRSVCAVNAGARSIEAALDFMRNTDFRQCDVCYIEFENESMTNVEECQHKACKRCVQAHLETLNSSRRDWACFACSNQLDRTLMLQKLSPHLTPDEWEKLNKPVLECCIEDDPEFRRCPYRECGLGFYTDLQLRKAQCPYCHRVMCNKCSSPWQREHENKTCEEFKEWRRLNDPDDPDFQAEEYMRNHGVACPGCEASFVVSKGGCAHLTCPKCKCEFCESCRSKFAKGAACDVKSEACKSKGFHAHHPRNCFFYTRDHPLDGLVNLLKGASVEMDDELPVDGQLCSIMIAADDGEESNCKEKALKGGKCQKHYKEYLCTLIIRNKLDTLSLMAIDQLKEELRKNDCSVPSLAAGTTEEDQRAQLEQLIKSSVPLAR